MIEKIVLDYLNEALDVPCYMEYPAAMDAIIIRPDISASKLNSDYNFTDAATKQYRYQAIYDLYYCNG